MIKNNLEGISFTEVTNENKISYSSFRNTLKPYYSKVFFDILKGYIFLILISASAIILYKKFPFLWWIILPISSILTGYTAAYLALFIHEAGHYHINPDKKKNEILATIFLCLPFGLSLPAYRKIHWQHHLHLGTPNDTETSYFNHLTNLFLLESLTGIHLLRVMIKKNKPCLLTKQQINSSRLMLAAGIIFHTLIILFSILSSNYLFIMTWILGFGIFFPFFATIRQVLEHRDELAHHATNFNIQQHGKISRLFYHTILTSSFGSAGFTRHLIHHWDPQISYTRLKDVEDFLSGCDKTAAILKSSKTTYTDVFKKLISAP